MKTSKEHRALLVSIALALMFTGAALRAQQTRQPQALPVPRQGQQPPAEESQTQQAPGEAETLHVLVRQPLVVSSPVRITRVSVADPGIIDTVVLNPYQVLINGKAAGNVSLVLRDQAGRSQEFYVCVDLDVRSIVDQVRQPFPDLTAQAKVQKKKLTWLGWVVIGSIALLAGAVVGTRRRPGIYLNKLDLSARTTASPDGYNEPELTVAPHHARAQRHPDEFAILTPETNTQQAEIPAEGLRAAVEADHFLHTHDVTASLGIADFPDHGRTQEETLGAADSGGDLAKYGNGNCVEVASLCPQPGNAERNERLLEAYLEAAVQGWYSAAPDTFSRCEPELEQMKPLWNTITALAFAVEAKGPYVEGHSRAVSRLAAHIATQSGLSQAEVEEIRLAGLVHDIGKLDVPEHMLMKPTPLTAEEFEIMKKHAAWGAKMLEPLNAKAIERIVRYHHERFDGNGYPDGLAGDGIPLGARIVAVAECFHSMVSDLPYESARTFEDALAELRRCSGKQFDPKVVAALLDWVNIYDDTHEQRGEDAAVFSAPQGILQPA